MATERWPPTVSGRLSGPPPPPEAAFPAPENRSSRRSAPMAAALGRPHRSAEPDGWSRWKPAPGGCVESRQTADMTGDPSRYATGQNTRWDLVAFSTHDDRLVGHFPITREQFIRVRELFDYGDDEWFADSYLVRPE